MEIHGWVLFDEYDRCVEAKKSLEADGYRVELRPQDGGTVIIAIPPESLSLDLVTARLQRVATDFGGEFLGSGRTHQVMLRRLPDG